MEKNTTTTNGAEVNYSEKKKCETWKTTYRITSSPKYYNLLKALTDADDRKRIGDTVRDIVKQYFDNMPEDQRRHLITRSKNHY